MSEGGWLSSETYSKEEVPHGGWASTRYFALTVYLLFISHPPGVPPINQYIEWRREGQSRAEQTLFCSNTHPSWALSFPRTLDLEVPSKPATLSPAVRIILLDRHVYHRKEPAHKNMGWNSLMNLVPFQSRPTQRAFVFFPFLLL